MKSDGELQGARTSSWPGLSFLVSRAIPFRGSYAAGLCHVSHPLSASCVGGRGWSRDHGYNLSVISVMGFIALSGVVVNDSLIMIVATNQFRKEVPPP